MSNDTDATYTKELAAYLKTRFAKQKAMIRQMRELRALLHEVSIPDEYAKTAHVVRTPILADMIQRITAQLTVNPVTWVRGLMGDRPSDEADSSLIERWLVAAHARMESQARRRIFRMLMDAAISDGMAVCQYLWQPERWAPFPRRRKNEPVVEQDGDEEPADAYLKRVRQHVRERPFPFSWRDIDPLTYFYWDSYDGRREVVLIEDVPLGPTVRSLGVRRVEGRWESASPGRPGDESSIGGESVELIQHWTDTDVTYLIDGQFAKRVQHNWGRLSIFDFAGLSTHERAPERAFVPVAFAFSQLIPFLDALLTMKWNAAYLNAFPRGVLKLARDRLEGMYQTLPESRANDRRAQLSTELGQLNSILTLYEDEDFRWATIPGVNEDLNHMIQLVSGLINQAGISDVLRGLSPVSDPNGYLYNQMTTMARLAYDPIVDNARFMFRDGAAFLLWAVDKLAKTAVPVWGEAESAAKRSGAWLELSSKHIGGIYDTEPQLKPLLPSNLIMEGRFWLEQWKQGGVDKRTYLERGLQIAAPEDIEKRQIIDEIKAHPAIRGRILDQVLRETGLAELAARPAAAGVGGMGGSVDLGNLGQPVTPGQGMPMEPTSMMREGMPMEPTSMMREGMPEVNPMAVPGAGPMGMPGGNFGRKLVTNVGE